MQAPLKGKPRRKAEEEVDDASSDDELERPNGDGAKKPMQITMQDAEAAAAGGNAEDEEDDPSTVRT